MSSTGYSVWTVNGKADVPVELSLPGSRAAASDGLRDSMALVRRRWVVVAVSLIVGLGLASLYNHVTKPVYSSTASVLVTPTGVEDSAQPVNGQGDRNPVNMETEAQLVKSTPVAALARELLDSRLDVLALTRSVATNVPQNTSVLDITFDAPSGQEASRGAQAFATAYLQNRLGVAESSLGERVVSVTTQLTDTQSRLQEVIAQRTSAVVGSPEAAFADAQASVLTGQLTTLSQAVSNLTATTVTPGRVIVDATAPTGPSTLDPLLVLVGGVLAGLALGLLLAFLRDRSDTHISTLADINRQGLPALSLAPGDHLAVVAAPTSAAAQEFRRLRNALAAMNPADRGVVLVAAAGPAGASDLVASNLAVALARSGARTTLLLLDSSSTAAGGDSVDRPMNAQNRLRVIRRGELADIVADGLQSQAAADLVASLRATSDYVVIHTASVTSSADAQSMARLVDAAAFVVVEAGRARADDLADAMQQFTAVGVTDVWGVLTPAQPRSHMPPSPAPTTQRGRRGPPLPAHPSRHLARSSRS
ncbi:MAG: Wzz/FepE/Etk N-terminal domain-containing protein [Geodermatophilaceae bacterium]